MNVKMSALVAALALSGTSAQAMDWVLAGIFGTAALSSASGKDANVEAPRAPRVRVAPLSPRGKNRLRASDVRSAAQLKIDAIAGQRDRDLAELDAQWNALDKAKKETEARESAARAAASSKEFADRDAKERKALLDALLAKLAMLPKNALEKWHVAADQALAEKAAAPTHDAREEKGTHVAELAKNYEGPASLSLSTSRNSTVALEKEVVSN